MDFSKYQFKTVKGQVRVYDEKGKNVGDAYAFAGLYFKTGMTAILKGFGLPDFENLQEEGQDEYERMYTDFANLLSREINLIDFSVPKTVAELTQSDAKTADE